MKAAIEEVLASKNIRVKEDHLPMLQTRWEGMQALKEATEQEKLADYDISLRNIPGGDHIE
ncbi:hypothetical protein [Bacillus piscicola]|uniref:hypothetical protein n=1 Tax=Bacillus piscicola TaxID=1632684 RepID=UPI001F08A50A|nr:hypothetical protein [Bacillus piscicola]